jgi:threonine/homoserine/homoserine lactone efflux protein
MLEQIFPFLIASIFLTLSPGPDIIYVLSQSLVGGYRRGLIIAAGLVTGIIVHTSLVAFGVSLVIKNSETLFWDFPQVRKPKLANLALAIIKQVWL